MKKNKKKLILASSSKNRILILKRMKVPFIAMSPKISEVPKVNEEPKLIAKRLSYEKALFAKKEFRNDYIIAADTIVYARKKVINKTNLVGQAKLNLKTLSGRRHRVFTGVTILQGDSKYFQHVCTSIVKFRLLSDKDIDEYLSLNEWVNCAGSYSIQGFAESFVEMISGSYSNVVGLPMHVIYKILKNNNFL